ncbi:MAG: type II toxin-antitoxin system VapC family toxin [Acidobacteria bacterium]|nr:type II toxin-antitoxin system VapC family toxin [Acidobacteriota bacterium]
MAICYYDSSAVVKRYAQETGTAWVISILDPAAGNTIYLARISAVEVISAFARRQRDRDLCRITGDLVTFSEPWQQLFAQELSKLRVAGQLAPTIPGLGVIDENRYQRHDSLFRNQIIENHRSWNLSLVGRSIE